MQRDVNSQSRSRCVRFRCYCHDVFGICSTGLCIDCLYANKNATALAFYMCGNLSHAQTGKISGSKTNLCNQFSFSQGRDQKVMLKRIQDPDTMMRMSQVHFPPLHSCVDGLLWMTIAACSSREAPWYTPIAKSLNSQDV